METLECLFSYFQFYFRQVFRLGAFLSPQSDLKLAIYQDFGGLKKPPNKILHENKIENMKMNVLKFPYMVYIIFYDDLWLTNGMLNFFVNFS